MLKFIDISNWQGDIALAETLASVDAVICKATEGTDFTDAYCDGFIQTAKNSGKLWGFYHFAGADSPAAEAQFFMEQCEGYFKYGVPVLDWEGNQSVAWVNAFVNEIHSAKGVWPIIYGNPWRFNQGGVDPNCARWVASYPAVSAPTFDQASAWDCPSADGNVVAWQFCSDGRLPGYAGNLDCNLFYGDAAAWQSYAAGAGGSGTITEPSQPVAPQGKKPLGKVNIRYALHVLGGLWWPEVVNDSDYAGAPFTKHDMLLMYVDKGSLKYRTHGTDGRWRDWVTGADYNDDVNGMAGDWGVPIDGVEIYYTTPDGYEYQCAYYKAQTINREGWLPTVCDDSDYAGWLTEPIDKLMAWIG